MVYIKQTQVVLLKLFVGVAGDALAEPLSGLAPLLLKFREDIDN